MKSLLALQQYVIWHIHVYWHVCCTTLQRTRGIDKISTYTLQIWSDKNNRKYKCKEFCLKQVAIAFDFHLSDKINFLWMMNILTVYKNKIMINIVMITRRLLQQPRHVWYVTCLFDYQLSCRTTKSSINEFYMLLSTSIYQVVRYLNHKIILF